jgi:Xaa-Pro aminopeptidase
LVDAGCVVDGYRSDMTRTLAVGAPDPEAAELHAVVQAARRAALERLAPGVTVEPGVYLPGHLGVRIEDEAVITETGHERLTSLSSELVVCD